MQKELNGERYTVVHVMKDGRVLDSIKGHMIEVNEKTKIAYMVLANLSDEEIEKLEEWMKKRK